MSYLITINKIGDGTVDSVPSLNSGDLSTLIVQDKSKISLIAIPSSGWKVKKWLNCSECEDTLCCINVDSDITIEIEFEEIEKIHFNLHISVEGDGYVSFNNSDVIFTEDTKIIEKNNCIMLSAVSNTLYGFSNWDGYDKININENAISFIMIEDVDIKAIFSTSYYIVINIMDGKGKVQDLINDIECNSIELYLFLENTILRLFPIPDDGYEFDYWDECQNCQSDNSCIHIVTSSITLTCHFKLKKCLLTVYIEGTGSGKIYIDSIKYDPSKPNLYDYNQTIIIAVIPNSNCKFDKWNISNNIEFSLKILDDITIICYLIKLYMLLVHVNDGGFISNPNYKIDCQSRCINYFNYNENILLIAYPIDGFRFLKWVNCDNSNGNSCNILMNSDKSVEAEFIKVYLITYEVIGNGEILLNGDVVSSPGNIKQFIYDKDIILNLEAKEYKNNLFIKWINVDSSNEKTASVTVINNRHIVVKFIKNIEFTIEFFGDGWGIIKDKNNIINCERKFIEYRDNNYILETINNTYIIPEETVLQLYFEPSDCTNDILWENCDSSDKLTSIKIIDDIFDYKNYINVFLSTKTYILLIKKSGTGTGTVISDNYEINCGKICRAELDCNQKIKLVATPDESSTFVGWIHGGENLTMTSNIFVQAEFKIKSFTVSISTSNGLVESSDGIISCSQSCSYTVNYGVELDLIAIPNVGYSFEKWTGIDDTFGSHASYTVKSDISITAVFKIRIFQLEVGVIYDQNSKDYCDDISVVSSPQGIDAPFVNTISEFEYNTNIKLTASDGSFCKFKKWVNYKGTITDNVCDFTITGNMDVSVRYGLKSFKLKLIISGPGKFEGKYYSCDESNCEYDVEAFSDVDMLVKPDSGNSLEKLMIDGIESSGDVINLTMDKDYTISATFSTKKVTLKVIIETSTSDPVSVKSSPSGISCDNSNLTSEKTFDYGSSVILTVSPISKFRKWSNATTLSSLTVTMKMDQTITAYFKA